MASRGPPRSRPRRSRRRGRRRTPCPRRDRSSGAGAARLARERRTLRIFAHPPATTDRVAGGFSASMWAITSASTSAPWRRVASTSRAGLSPSASARTASTPSELSAPPDAHPEVGPVGRQRHHLGVDPLPAGGVVDADQLEGAPHQQARPGAGEHHAVPGQHVAHHVDAVPGQPLAGVRGRAPRRASGRAPRRCPSSRRACRRRARRTRRRRRGGRGRPRSARHRTSTPARGGWPCPTPSPRRSAAGPGRSSTPSASTARGQTCPVSWSSSPVRPASEISARRAPPSHQVTSSGTLSHCRPRSSRPVVPVAVPQLGEGRQRTERQAGAAGELRAEVGRHVGHVLGAARVEPGHDRAGDPVVGVEQGAGLGHPRDADPGDGGAVGAELGEHLLDRGEQHAPPRSRSDRAAGSATAWGGGQRRSRCRRRRARP